MIDGDNCRNCGCGEFVADYQRGNVVCVECGCEDAYGQLQVADATYDDCVDAFGCRIFAAPPRESVVSGAYFTTPALERAVAASTRKNSPPYKRETYWSERISQWRMLEPGIPVDDMQRICEAYEFIAGRYEDGFHPKSKIHERFKHLAGTWLRDKYGCVRPNPRHVLDKEDCRAILWSIDRDIAESGSGKQVFVKVTFSVYQTCTEDVDGRCIFPL